MHKLISLEISIPETDKGRVPEQIPIFYYGKTPYTKNGKELSYTFLEADADAAIAKFRRKGVDMMIDYNHQQLFSKKNGQPAPASGWITEFVKLEDGLYGKVKWTPSAKAAIENREFRYISPTFFTDKTGAVVEIYNVALTNKPATYNAVDITALEAEFNPPDPGTTTKGALMKKTLELLGLEDSADDSQAAVAVKALQDSLAVLQNNEKGFIDALKKPLALADDADLSTVQGIVLGLADKAKTADNAIAKVTALEEKIDSDKRDALILAALEDGRLCNAQKEWAEGLKLTALEAFLEKAPANKSFPADRINRDKLNKDAPIALSDADREVCAAMGLDEDEFLKTKQGE